MVSGFETMVFVSHTEVSDTKTMVEASKIMVEDDHQIIGTSGLSATADFDHGLCRSDHGLWRREDVLQLRNHLLKGGDRGRDPGDHLLKAGDRGRGPGDHLPGYRSLGLDDQSNGLPRRDHGLWNQDTFLRSGTRFLRI